MSHPPAGYGYPGAVVPQPPKKSRAGWIIVGMVVVLLLIGGFVTTAVFAGRSGPGESAGMESGSPSSAEPNPDSPTELLEGFVEAIKDHDLDGARSYLCEEPKDIPLPDEGEEGAFWAEVDASEYYVGDENMLDEDEAMIHLTQKRDDVRTYIIVDTVIEDGRWRMCDWYEDTF